MKEIEMKKCNVCNCYYYINKDCGCVSYFENARYYFLWDMSAGVTCTKLRQNDTKFITKIKNSIINILKVKRFRRSVRM